MKHDNAHDPCLTNFTRQRSGPVEAFNIVIGSCLRSDATSRITSRRHWTTCEWNFREPRAKLIARDVAMTF